MNPDGKAHTTAERLVRCPGRSQGPGSEQGPAADALRSSRAWKREIHFQRVQPGDVTPRANAMLAPTMV
jgi:hypothetical protein